MRPIDRYAALLFRVGQFVVALAVALLVRILRSTWRLRICGRLPDGPALFAFWHGDQLALSGLRLPRRVAVLVSRSSDGEWAARSARWLGYDVVRGSTSRGGVPGALGLARRLRSGRSVGIAVDGPRGPWHRATERPARLAHRCGAHLVPVAAAPRHAMTLGSWDRLVIPAPFSTIYIVVGAPVSWGSCGLQGCLERAWSEATALTRRKGRR